MSRIVKDARQTEHQRAVDRRSFVSGVAALGSLSLFSSAQAAAGPSVMQTHEAGGLLDPVTRYPAPPFAQQPQNWPGLQSAMTPRPDCGEAHYQGSGRLAGRKALITGGDSGIGRAVRLLMRARGPMLLSATCRKRKVMRVRLRLLSVKQGEKPCYCRVIFVRKQPARPSYIKRSMRWVGWIFWLIMQGGSIIVRIFLSLRLRSLTGQSRRIFTHSFGL